MCESVRQSDVVAIHPGDVCAGGCPDRLIEGFREPNIPLIPHDDDMAIGRRVFAEDPRRGFGGTVIDYDELKITHTLSEYAFDREAEKVRPSIMNRHYD